MSDIKNLVKKMDPEEAKSRDSDSSASKKELEQSTRCELLSFYSRQANPYSCSAASVAIVLNSMRAKLNRFRPVPPVSQEELVNKIQVANWKKKVSMRGFRGKHGLSIRELGEVLEASMKAFSIPYRDLRTVSIYPGMENPGGQKDRLFSLLAELTENFDLYIIAHFTQGVYTGDWFGSHISPVGDFDPQSESVFVLDVDLEVEGPYWISLDTFFEGMVGEAKTLGTKGGGYVAVRVEAPPV